MNEKTIGIVQLLQTVVRTLALIPTGDLDKYVEAIRLQNFEFSNFGPILAPTAYRDAAQSGAIEDARIQLEITELLLEARKLIDDREIMVKKLKENALSESRPGEEE